jgi:prepilin-type N-terminal cleavage/methylation domain-containing protein/prepilin-type processing-associated H-X9-DG protein
MPRYRLNNAHGRGFTLIELLVVIAIIAILAAILFPVFAQAREKARQINCVSNLKNISTAVMMYIQDYDENMPYYETQPPAVQTPTNRNFWFVQINPYLKANKIYSCPSLGVSGATFETMPNRVAGYGVNAGAHVFPNYTDPAISYSAFTTPAGVLMMTDSAFMDPKLGSAGYPVVYCPFRTVAGVVNGAVANRHFDGSSVAFLDGHVKYMKLVQIIAGGKDPNIDLWAHFQRGAKPDF